VKPSPPDVIVLLLIYAAFVSLGLPDGIHGAAWPAVRAHFGAALNDNWPILTLSTLGGLLSSFLSGVALRRLGVGKVLILTTFLTAFVILGYALSPTLAAMAALGFFLGLGNGAIDAGLNHFAASNLSSRHMNWLHAFWGVGISIGTLIVSGVFALGGTWRIAYVAVGLPQLCLAAAFLVGLRSPLSSVHEAASEQQREQPALLATLRLPSARASMASFFVYCGVECATGLWIASVLHDGRGWTMQASGLMTTVYWGSLTVGRFLIGTISQRTTPMRIVRIAVFGVIAGTSLIALSSALPGRGVSAGLVTAFGLQLTGLSLSPIFPMLMHDTPRCVGQGHALNLIGFQSASANLGYTLLPIVLGTIMRNNSTEWLGSMLLVLASVLFALLVLRDRHAMSTQKPFG
jgi:fucose permease